MHPMRDMVGRIRGGLSPLFLMTVALPTAISAIYFGIFASDVYISESKFVVRSPDKPETTGFGVLLKTAGFSSAGDEVFAAQNYIESRDALRAINHGEAFRRAYGSSSISFFNRFDPIGMFGSFEDLYEYFRAKVTVGYDSSSSITTQIGRAHV